VSVKCKHSTFLSTKQSLKSGCETPSYGHTLRFSPGAYDVHDSSNETNEEKAKEDSNYNNSLL